MTDTAFAAKESQFKADIAAEIERLKAIHINLKALDPREYLPEVYGGPGGGGPGPLIEFRTAADAAPAPAAGRPSALQQFVEELHAIMRSQDAAAAERAAARMAAAESDTEK